MPLPSALKSRIPAQDALKAVRAVIERQTQPIKTQELYKQALKESVGSEVEGNGIQSMSYMKRVLLPALVGQQVVGKIHVKPTLIGTEKAQQLAKLSKSQRQTTAVKTALHGYFGWVATKPKTPHTPKTPEEPFGTAVGVGEDWGHLNKRRQRSRGEKVQRDVEWLKEIETARQEAAPVKPTS
ncbi:hypothetical protein BDY19DRAFT_1072238 [Irpex rosettiformis]|uniref:Uncharacterized protein n=1 Tax=Irpex rosettiformis TaxID=378272 RepID=A0ACB8U2D5_9APHY|nr:hypothetical protein BDY19DRAFT_1072238 [Irpex rosettiformis]